MSTSTTIPCILQSFLLLSQFAGSCNSYEGYGDQDQHKQVGKLVISYLVYPIDGKRHSTVFSLDISCNHQGHPKLSATLAKLRTQPAMMLFFVRGRVMKNAISNSLLPSIQAASSTLLSTAPMEMKQSSP